MFWGCFAGSRKGRCLLWEKGWGTLNSDAYCERIVPLIESELSERSSTSLMQDNAPPHTASQTIRKLAEINIYPIIWPAFSPDLNPIEAVWNIMKDFIQSKYPDLGCGRIRTQEQLREIAREAWDSITTEELSLLVMSMPARCRAVVEANGGSTRN